MTDSVYRRTLSELITRYKFEPSLRDIYVEGERDKYFISWFLQKCGLSNPKVYGIGSVEISNEHLEKLDVVGNWGRVIALCFAIHESLGENCESIRGIADRSDAASPEKFYAYRTLLFTDFSCLEAYAYSSHALEKFSKIYLGKLLSNDQISDMSQILTELFLIRRAKVSLKTDTPWPKRFDQLCSLKSSRLYFDREEFIRRLSNLGQGKFDEDLLREKIEEHRRALLDDVRLHIHGHDLVGLLSWFAKKLGVDAAIANHKPLHRALICSVEHEELAQTSMFSSLITWATEPAS